MTISFAGRELPLLILALFLAVPASLAAWVLVATPLAAAPPEVEPIRWHATYAAAQAAARSTGKPIFAAFR